MPFGSAIVKGLGDSFSDIPIRLKLALIIGLATGFAIIVAGIAVLIYEADTFRPRSLEEAKTHADILAEILVPSLVFRDSDAAASDLATLHYTQDIKAAAVYDSHGDFFAEYRRVDGKGKGWTKPSIPLKVPRPGARFKPRELTYVAAIADSGVSEVGFVWLDTELPPIYARLPQYGIMFGVLILSLLALAALLAIGLKQSVILPITSLAKTALSVIGKKDYSLRASGSGKDEIGNLTQTFNQMLEVIEQSDRSLRESEERFSKAFHDNPTPMSIIRISDGIFIDVNESALALTGLKREELIGHTGLETGIIDPNQREMMRKMMDERGSIRDLEMKLGTKSGEKVDVLSSMQVIEVGREKCFLSISSDITHRKQVEEQLRQSQKMEAVGRLAGGIAHDFNNLLTAINGYSGLILQDMEPTHPLYGFLREILKSGERAAGLTKQLLAYSRKQVMEPKLWDLNLIVGDMEGMLKRLIGEDVVLVSELSHDIGPVKVDRGQVEQIILNLAINARDAMPEGGQLTLRTEAVSLSEALNGLHFEIAPGRYVVLSVRDTGIGMTPEVKARLFEPFFTTKDVSKGTGLGLSVVYGIVRQSGGSVSVSSEPGRGANFRIYFPAMASLGAGAAVFQPEEGPEAHRGDETILLVEDEKSVRKFTRLALEASGYRVFEAGNGVEALGMLASLSPRVDLVITDMVMPDMGGVVLAKRIHERMPMVPVIFISGYPEQGFRHHGALDSGETLLQKPFTPSELARKVREVLEPARRK